MPPQAQSQSGQTPSQSNPHQHPGIAQTTSAPVVPTVTSSPLPQQSQTNLQPPPQSQESSGMSMSDLLSKLSQTASPAPANAISQPFPGPPATGPGAGFPQPPMNGGGQHLYPGNGVPDTLHHSNSWSVGQIPSPHPHHMGGTASPQRGPAYPHPMAGHSSPRPQNFPPSSGTHHAADLTASLKQMLGLGAAASPNRAPSEGHINNTMTPGPQRNGLAHPMTPTRRFDDPRSFHHGATPPPIHLAPALDTMNARSRSPLQTPSLQQSTVSTGNLSQPPSRQLSQRQIQTNSPHNSFASPANAQLRQANQGYVPNPNRNGDPFAIGGSSGSTAVHNIDTNGVTNAVVDTWNNTTQKDGLPGNQAPNEDDKEQKRDFVRALLSAIHVSLFRFPIFARPKC
ncbi:hypothetical protein QFC24_006718 [Naganishia onofrii]|uniref:Uncharacterized protein n=1 Tax=Naganishia onofrii TaxID=1851511 RepID=A0ACC2X0G8_9TREE|nr:hypothetical protein QFC24_006718 [Naganishia onofrii]